ncbi:hypothetical protein N311_02457, partial [Apaloderma vittatum]
SGRIATLDFRRANFGLFKQLLGETPWDRELEGKGAQESWSVFKDHFFQAQNQGIPAGRKSIKRSRRPAWLTRDLLGRLRWKGRVYKLWKEGLATLVEYRTAVREGREAIRKAKASFELKLVREVKENRKGFFKYIAGKTNTRGNVGPLVNEMGVLETEDRKKAELPNTFFASVYT